MLTDLCQELRNWFDRGQPKWFGDFTIENGALVLRSDMSLKDGQYFRICGSALNDGVYQYGNTQLIVDDEEGVPDTLSFSLNEDGHLIQTSEGATPRYRAQLTDETFHGSVWAMAIPPAVIALSTDIDEWVEKNAEIIASPYSSESFGGYSYTKRNGTSANGSSNSVFGWQDAFRSRLNRWRKI